MGDVIWASRLPSGPLGDMVRETARDAGVCLDHCAMDEGGEIGTFTVLPEESKVHFQRKNSSFAGQPEELVAWKKILSPGRTWLHLSGISPMISAAAANCWETGLKVAAVEGLPVSLDLNHRPQLGTLEHLWSLVAPNLAGIHLLILSSASVQGVAELLGLADGRAAKKARPVGVAAVKGDGTTASALQLLKLIHNKLAGPAVACCLKERDPTDLQRRWSVIIDACGVNSTDAIPVLHTPKDECGGGSAWAAGVIDGLSEGLNEVGRRCFLRQDGFVVLDPRPMAAIRRADLLAALSQETIGDHSTVTRPQLLADELRFAGTAADLCRPMEGKKDAALLLQQALAQMDGAKVVAILRAKNEVKAVERARELADLGFKAVEITCDSAGFDAGRLLPAVAAAVGDRCLVGVGTVTTLEQLKIAAEGGARFALSPVRPTHHGFGSHGFVGECHQRGILAMPAACSPQEIYECVEGEGALTVKIFPAQLWSPSSLRDLRRIGDFGKYRLCPSGGIDHANVEAWLAAGAWSCGMGSCLAGKDIATDPNDVAALKTAEEDWVTRGRPAAASLAKRLFMQEKSASNV